ncbi:S-adenosyl-L-methionine-dependent methyltransferase [Xylariales sp. AK1849]|nr:S-adenosyl-L-methionine-dependent methyltransferase [Xylariales sp. AK1849]
MEELQKIYTSFTAGKTDEEIDRVLDNGDQIMGRSAALLLDQAGLNASTKKPFKLLDNACGMGTVGAQLQPTVDKSVLEKSRFLCADVNEQFIDVLKKRAEMKRWVNTDAVVADAQDSKLPDRSFTHVTISHGLHVIPDPDAALKDTLRVLQPRGVFACSTMHKNNSAWVPDIRSAFLSISPELKLPDPMPMAANGKLEWTKPNRIEEKLREHGFEGVLVETIQQVQYMKSPEQFVDMFGMMLNWLVGVYWNEEQKEKYQGTMKKEVVKHLREKHGGEGWHLDWTMILATCQTPS